MKTDSQMSLYSKWFEEILGWYGQIESKDEACNGNYGGVNKYTDRNRISSYCSIYWDPHAQRRTAPTECRSSLTFFE